MIKKCTRCGEEKGLDEFSRNKRFKDGFQYNCNKCRAIDRKKWRSENPEKVKESKRKWRENNPEKASVHQKKKILDKASVSTKHTYLLTDGESIKIGTFTEGKIERRLSMLQTGNPRKLKVLATSANNIEKLCHYEFEHLNVLNEWFKMDLELITFFTENAE